MARILAWRVIYPDDGLKSGWIDGEPRFDQIRMIEGHGCKPEYAYEGETPGTRPYVDPDVYQKTCNENAALREHVRKLHKALSDLREAIARANRILAEPVP